MQLTTMFRIIFALIVTLQLASCSLFSPVNVQPRVKYRINTIPNCVPNALPHPVTLLVEPPEAEPIFYTRRMAFSMCPHEIAYYVKNEWAESPTQMLQAAMVTTLQKVHCLAVLTPPYLNGYDYVLHSRLIELLQDFNHHPTLLKLRMSVELIRADDNKVIAKKIICVNRVQAPCPQGGAYAANLAAAEMLRQVAAFVLQAING